LARCFRKQRLTQMTRCSRKQRLPYFARCFRKQRLPNLARCFQKQRLTQMTRCSRKQRLPYFARCFGKQRLTVSTRCFRKECGTRASVGPRFYGCYRRVRKPGPRRARVATLRDHGAMVGRAPPPSLTCGGVSQTKTLAGRLPYATSHTLYATSHTLYHVPLLPWYATSHLQLPLIWEALGVLQPISNIIISRHAFLGRVK
jgi:hypothetical protein